MIEFQGDLQPLAFAGVLVSSLALFVVEVFRVHEDQPASAFENLPIQFEREWSLGFALKVAAEVGQPLVEGLDHVEVVEDVISVGEVFADGEDVGGRHIGGDGFDPGTSRFEPFPEGFEGIGPFSVANEQDGATLQIEHDGEIVMALADRDFVDGNAGDMLEFRKTNPELQSAFEQCLDQVPADLQVIRHSLNGHMGQEVEGVSFESMGHPLEWPGDGDGS